MQLKIMRNKKAFNKLKAFLYRMYAGIIIRYPSLLL